MRPGCVLTCLKPRKSMFRNWDFLSLDLGLECNILRLAKLILGPSKQ